MTKKYSVFILAVFFSTVITISVQGEEGRPMKLTSPSFVDKGDIPKKYTCDGKNVSPALTWTDIPAGAKSLALIVDDPDAPDPENPRMTWVHWVLYNIPTTVDSLPEGVLENDLPEGTLEGLNDWKKTGYGGPCPPIGKHRYFHKLYALDTVLSDLGLPTKAKLEQALKNHVLSQAQLIGLYQRK
jgi:Raf kinase inhibitor-like YbhB/YbcL family protein